MHEFRPIHWLVIQIILLYTRITCRMDASDLDRVPRKGPLIVISNHAGQIEVPMLFAHLQPRPLTAWAKAETWDNWFLRWVFDLWGIIPIRRGEADMNALRLALKALEDGVILGIAPEGTRNKTGKLLRGMPGVAILALHSGAPILPLAHWGGEMFLRNLKRFERTDFHVRVGDLFILDAGTTKVTGAMRQEIVDEMMFRLAALLPEEYRGTYSNPEKTTFKYTKTYTS
jgi:1-acyl-sn-glycerol-3-phosphate acyltransferase